MRYGYNDSIIFRSHVQRIAYRYIIITQHYFFIGPWVMYINLQPKLNEFIVNVYYAGIPHIRAILFECKAHYQRPGILYFMILGYHQFHDLIGHKGPHIIIYPAARQDHLRMIA